MKPHRLLSLLLLPALLPLFTSCTDTLLETPAAGSANADIPEGYYFILDTDVPQNAPQTRVAYADINHSYFEEDDRLGIYVIGKDGNRITDAPANAQYKVTNVTNITTGTVRQVLENVGTDVPRGEGYRYVIYYPYNPDMTFDRLKDLTHSVQPDQHADPASTTSLTPYEQSDLLWDVVSELTSNGTPYVEIHMDHAMANIILNIDEKYVQAGSSEKDYEVYIVNSPATASGINLTQGLETEGWGYNVPTSTPDAPTVFPSIRMWYTGYGTSGELQFRAVIPACQTISNNGSAFFQITDPNGTPKEYKLNAPLTLKPGKNYIFNIRESGGSIIPEVTDDDSWVLDVLDPETGEPVGLLCREYLRYQPDHNNTTEPDEKTGTKASNGKLNINSQAWVFYNLQPGTTIPDLNKGTVLRFIYDIHMSARLSEGNITIDVTDAASYWPLPHKQGDMVRHQGLFTPEHGYKWIADPTKEYGISSNETGEGEETLYYMHGGNITWNANEDKISDFSQNTDLKIDYNTAKNYGHIAIVGTQAFVDYSKVEKEAMKDEKGQKVGIIVPHYLVDKRISVDGKQEITKYPLVKIGYNQFWISKPFKAKVLTDGTPITCYNQLGTNGSKPADVTFSSADLLDMGYIYPFSQIDDKIYDPYNDPTEMAGYTDENGKLKYEPAPLYNKPAVDNEKFVPTSENSDQYYVMPTLNDIEKMTNYFGILFAAKMETREIAQKKGQDYIYDKYTAITRGETYESGGDFFTANISGFNLRAIGYYLHKDVGYTSIGASASLILNSKGYDGVNYLNFEVHNAWKIKFKVSPSTDNDNDGACLLHENMLTFSPYYPSQFFAQVRILMKYRNQADTGGSSSISTSSATRSLGENVQSESRNIYIPIQPAD